MPKFSARVGFRRRQSHCAISCARSRGATASAQSAQSAQSARCLKPAAAAAVVTTFSFPLILMVAVLLFLLVQSRLDGRDPKLRAAPLTASETILPFRDEDQL